MGYSSQQLIVFFSVIPVIIAAIVGSIKYRQLQPTSRYLYFLVLFALFTEVFSRVLWFYSISNLFLWPLYTGLEFVLLALIYGLVLKDYFIGKTIPYIMYGFVVLSLLIIIFQELSKFNTLHRFLESLLIIVFVLSYYYKLLKEVSVNNLERSPEFWFSSGLFLYFTGNIFIFIFSNFILLYSKEFNLQVWSIHALLNILLYSFYTVALWLNPKK